jgi:hypothetical protein
MELADHLGFTNVLTRIIHDPATADRRRIPSLMRKNALFSLALTALVLVAWSADPAGRGSWAAAAQSSENSKGPQSYYPEYAYDFGLIPQGPEVKHTFVVENRGTAPLRIIKAEGT